MNPVKLQLSTTSGEVHSIKCFATFNQPGEKTLQNPCKIAKIKAIKVNKGKIFYDQTANPLRMPANS